PVLAPSPPRRSADLPFRPSDIPFTNAGQPVFHGVYELIFSPIRRCGEAISNDSMKKNLSDQFFGGRLAGRIALFLGVILIGPITSATAQETTPLVNSILDGVVLDAETEEPLAGATLQLEGITHSTKSDIPGR